jgi:lysophospholipase L1-like esterase
MNMKKILLLIVTVAGVSLSAVAQSVQPFRDGDRAVFLGNSITDGGHYHSYIWLYYMTRFPEMDLRVINAGIGGDTAENMFNRLDSDVFDKRPTVLTMTFGMNDSGYFEYNGEGATEFGEKKYAECYDNYKKVESRLKTLSGVRIVQMGSSPYDETARIENTAFRGKNAVMKRIVEFQKQSASENGWEFLDLNAPMTGIAAREQAKDPAYALCGNDRIHPDNEGHMVMAWLYLKAQGFAGKEVADVEIDANRGKVDKSKNCEISNLRKNGRDLSFDYLAAALPYPLDTLPRGWGARRSQADAAGTIPFMEEMNREMLTVKGLKGNYRLLIDGVEIGEWSGDDFARGINLAEQSWTPQYRQALSVLHLNEYRWEIERSFREMAWIEYNFFRPLGKLGVYDQAAVAEIDREKLNNGWVNSHRDIYSKYMHEDVRRAREREMEFLIEKIYEINKPVTRSVTLHRIAE